MTEIVSQNANSGSSDFTINPSNTMKYESPYTLESSVSDTKVQKAETKLNTEYSIGKVSLSKGKDTNTIPNTAESIATAKPKGKINFQFFNLVTKSFYTYCVSNLLYDAFSFSNLGKLAEATVLHCCLRPDHSGCDCGPMEKGKVYLINCSGNT